MIRDEITKKKLQRAKWIKFNKKKNKRRVKSKNKIK